MNTQKNANNKSIHVHIIKYITLVLLFSLIFQFFIDRVLSRYELFLATNYNDLLVNLFTAQVTIIILPLSMFGIFTEITNEVYLGQSIAEYMYMYRGTHFFAFSYKELIISSMLLTLSEYVLMSKGLLAAELATLVLNTTAMLVSLFSWFEVRIQKEKLHAFIQKQLYMKIETCTKPEMNNTYENERILIHLLSKLKDWVVNGGDNELVEAMHFYENLYRHIGFWNMTVLVQNAEKEETIKELFSSYKNPDAYFDEMVAELLRKQDYYRALRCSKRMLEIIAWYRVKKYYHPNHYHYRILLNLFRKISEMEIELLGDRWFCNYLVSILKNGNVKGYLALAAQTEKTENPGELQHIIEEGYILVYEFLMSIWQNDNLQPEYKQKQMKIFLWESIMDPVIENSALCVSMKLMETKEQTIIDMVVKNNWKMTDPFNKFGFPTEKITWERFEKSMVLILAYGYYLSVYTSQDITVPKLKYYEYDKKIDMIKEHYIWEILTYCEWNWFDEIKTFLDRNPKLDESFRQHYYNTIYDIILYNAMANRQHLIHAKSSTDVFNKMIRHFKEITSNDELLETVISRYKKYIDLFMTRDLITNKMINDQFYEFKKIILQYYLESMKRTVKGFNKEAFCEDLKRKVWEEFLMDQHFDINSSNVQASNEGIVDVAVFARYYFISPYEEDYDAHQIKNWLCSRILRKNASKEDACGQETAKTYNVLSLEMDDEKLDDEEIEYLIKKEKGFNVRFHFYPKDTNTIFGMNFRTYKEAYEFIKSEYRKIVFRMKIKI